MALREIVTLPHPVLRQRARPVTDFGRELQQLVDDMWETMHAAHGMGLAANQVGIPARVIVVEVPMPESDDEEPLPHAGERFTLVNPRISWHTREMVSGVEGCLSLPGLAGEVERYKEIRIEAQDRRGKRFRKRLAGWIARVFQHEIDHLSGVVYTDHIDDPEKVWSVAPGEEEREGAKAAVLA
jgi:peptide deformylase